MARPSDVATLEKYLQEIGADIRTASPEEKPQLEAIKGQIVQDLKTAYQSENARSEGQGFGMPALIGIGSGINRVAQDAASIPMWLADATGITKDGSFEQYRAGVNEERALMDPLKAQFPTARAGETVGEMVATLPLGGFSGVTAGTKVLPSLITGSRTGRVLANTALGAAQGALGAEDPLSGALIGGAGTGLLAGAGEAWQAGTAALRGVSQPPSALRGVDIMPADVSPLARGAQALASSIPGPAGTVRAARETQQEQLKQAVGRLSDNYPSSDRDILQSLDARKNHRKEMARRLYDQVEQQVGGNPVTHSEWRNQATSLLKAEQAKPDLRQDKGLIKTLEGYLSEPTTANWSDMRRLRSDIKADVRGTFKGTSQVGERSTGALQQVLRELEDDLKLSIPPDARAMSDLADTFYKTNVAQPYGRKGSSFIRTAMSKESSDDAVNMLLTPRIAGNAELVEKAYKGLDRAGIEEIRHQLVQGMTEYGTKPDGAVDPVAMARYIQDRLPAFERFLPKEDAAKMAEFLGKMRGVSEGQGTQLIRGITATTPLVAGGIGAAMTPGTSDSGIVDKLMAGAGYAGTAGALEGAVGGVAAMMATGRPGPVLNTVLRSLITTSGRLHNPEEEEDRSY